MAKGKGTTKTVEEMNIQNVQEEVVETIEKNVETTSSVILEENKKEVEEKTEPLKDTDEIKVISLIPNVSYKDKATGDYYKWNAVNDSELMTFETLKNMNRNHKSYLRDLWLKPLDKRAIEKLGLTSTYNKYEFLMNEKNYTRDNIDEV